MVTMMLSSCPCLLTEKITGGFFQCSLLEYAPHFPSVKDGCFDPSVKITMKSCEFAI